MRRKVAAGQPVGQPVGHSVGHSVGPEEQLADGQV